MLGRFTPGTDDPRKMVTTKNTTSSVTTITLASRTRRRRRQRLPSGSKKIGLGPGIMRGESIVAAGGRSGQLSAGGWDCPRFSLDINPFAAKTTRILAGFDGRLASPAGTNLRMLYSPRARTRAQFDSGHRAATVLASAAGTSQVVPGLHLGGTRAAVAVLFSVSPRYRRFADLWRHRQQLARPRHLRSYPRRGRSADLDPPARLSGVSGAVLQALRTRALPRRIAGADRHRHCRLLRHRRPGATDCFDQGRAVGVRAGGAVSLHCQLHRRALGRDAQHLLYCRRARRRGRGVHALRGRIVVVESMDWLRRGSCGRNSTASRRRHSAGGDWPVSAVAHVEAAGAASATLLGRNAGAGDFPRPAGSLDGSQLARVSQVRAARAPLCQRSRRVRSLRLRSLGAHLDRRLRLDRRNLLADSGQRCRFESAALARLRQRAGAGANPGDLRRLRQVPLCGT